MFMYEDQSVSALVFRAKTIYDEEGPYMVCTSSDHEWLMRRHANSDWQVYHAASADEGSGPLYLGSEPSLMDVIEVIQCINPGKSIRIFQDDELD